MGHSSIFVGPSEEARMQKVVLDNSTRDTLSAVDKADLCDEQGHVLGRYLSNEAFRRFVYDLAKTQLTDEQIERRLKEPGGRSLEEIWQRLGAN